MPSFDIVKKTEPADTFRVSSVKNNFDLKVEKVEERFTGEIDIEGEDWNVGAIVGGSGTGKSTIARQVFGEDYIEDLDYGDEAIIDEMPEDKSVKEIQKMFTSVGFASPPSWIKPYHVLSNGEKMRVDLARALLTQEELVVFDEFTSVVDRDVAKTGSHAVSKATRKSGKKFVAVSCHKDIINWLEPDWVYDTDQKQFFFTGTTSDPSGPKSSSTFTGLVTKLKGEYGTFSKSITI